MCFFNEKTARFLKSEKIRSKKVLERFQKDRKLYLRSLEQGVWFPIVQIDFVEYKISVEGFDEPFDDSWEQLFEYEGFNIESADGLWVSGIGALLKFEPEKYVGEGVESVGTYGNKFFDSSKERWYETLNHHRFHSDYHYEIPSGKYLMTVKGYKLVDKNDSKKNKLGYRFEFKKTDEFIEARNPREDTLYEFNIGWLADSKETIIHWISKEEGGYGGEPKKFTPTIYAEDGRTSHVVLILDKLHPSNDKLTDNYRARAMMNYCQLESGKEYDLFHDIYKLGKSRYVKVGHMEVR